MSCNITGLSTSYKRADKLYCIPKPYEFLPSFCDILQYFLLMLMYNCYTLELKAVSQHDFITYTYV